MATISQYKEVEKVAVLIPAFCEERTVGDVVTQALVCVPDVIVVDDASTDKTATCAEAAGAKVIRRKVNGGKGAATVYVSVTVELPGSMATVCVLTSVPPA